jgi:transposase
MAEADEAAEQLKRAIEKARGDGKRYGEELKGQIRRYLQQWGEGRSVAKIAEELGISTCTLHFWKQQWAEKGKLVRVRIKPAAAEVERRVMLVSPNGFRVEGLSMEEAAELLRRVG